MNFVGALRIYLLADSAISASVGARIYIGAAPQNAAEPYVILSLINEDIQIGLNQQEDLWQIDTWSKSYDISEGLSCRMRDKINGLYNVKFGNYKIYSVTQESRQMMTEPDGNGTENVWTRFSGDYTIVRDSAETT